MLLIRVIFRPARGGPDEVIGEAAIFNDGSGGSDVGNYQASLYLADGYSRTLPAWKRAAVRNFPRLVAGPWDLLLAALQAFAALKPIGPPSPSVSSRAGGPKDA